MLIVPVYTTHGTQQHVSSARSATQSQPVSQCVAGSQECRLTHNDLTETLLLRCSTLGNIDESLRIYIDAHEPFPAKVTKSTKLQRMSRKLVILKVTMYTSHGIICFDCRWKSWGDGRPWRRGRCSIPPLALFLRFGGRVSDAETPEDPSCRSGGLSTATEKKRWLLKESMLYQSYLRKECIATDAFFRRWFLTTYIFLTFVNLGYIIWAINTVTYKKYICILCNLQYFLDTSILNIHRRYVGEVTNFTVW